MNSNSNILGKYKTSSAGIPSEILNWHYENNEDSIIVVWNESNEIKYISNNAEHWFEHPVKDLIGKEWTHFFSSMQTKQIENHFQISEEKLEIPHTLYSTTNGNEHSFHTVIDKIIIDSENCYICKMKDNTYVNELKSVLQDSEKLILAGQLSAGLVHEIRNPLTSLKGFLQLIQAGIQQQEKYFHVMISEIEKLEKITSELLHMAKPFQNVPKEELVEELIQDVLFIMSTQTDYRDVYFITDLEKDLTIHCDASQIKQVLINVIKNGAEAMEKSGVIKIETRIENGYAAIHVMDEGQGISNEMVNEVGTPFFTTKSTGTGLGLAITNYILDVHQGKLRITSDEELGTNFTILLPLTGI